MASTEMTGGEGTERVPMARGSVSRREETKVSFLTTEFYVLLATVAGILVAVAQADNFDSPRAWTLIAAVAIGYMISRGLAKSGSAHRERDDHV